MKIEAPRPTSAVNKSLIAGFSVERAPFVQASQTLFDPHPEKLWPHHALAWS